MVLNHDETQIKATRELHQPQRLLCFVVTEPEVATSEIEHRINTSETRNEKYLPKSKKDMSQENEPMVSTTDHLGINYILPACTPEYAFVCLQCTPKKRGGREKGEREMKAKETPSK